MTALLPDASCYHATFASVLHSYGCASPPLVLGSSASTHARLDGDELAFDDGYHDLAARCAERGYRCARRPAHASGAWETTLRRLQRGVPVIALVDPFHLPYYWIDYGRTHSRHAVILWSADEGGRRVRLSDASDLLRYDAEVALAEIAAAWTAEDRGQAWIDVDPPDGGAQALAPAPAAVLLRESAAHAAALVADGETLSCAGLARHVLERFDHYLELTLRVGEANARLGTDERRRRSSHFLRGIWNVHHTMRWLARYTEAVARVTERPVSATSAGGLDEIAQSWLLVRNVFLKRAVSTPARRATLADHGAARLRRIAARAEALAEELAPHFLGQLTSTEPARAAGEDRHRCA